ncbi:hypothetical protein D3C78_1598380 [compost metagenome]
MRQEFGYWINSLDCLRQYPSREGEREHFILQRSKETARKAAQPVAINHKALIVQGFA